MPSLLGVQVGERLTIKGGVGRECTATVTKVGRQFVTLSDKNRYSIETGMRAGPIFGCGYQAYTDAALLRSHVRSEIRRAAEELEKATRQLDADFQHPIETLADVLQDIQNLTDRLARPPSQTVP